MTKADVGDPVSCFTKPVDLDKFIEVVKAVENFWLTIVKLPPREA